MLFLKYLDDLEGERAMEAELKYYAIADAVAELGKAATIRAMFSGFQKQLYRSVAA